MEKSGKEVMVLIIIWILTIIVPVSIGWLMKSTIGIYGGITVILGIWFLLLLSAMYKVPEKTVAIQTFFGKFDGVKYPGLEISYPRMGIYKPKAVSYKTADHSLFVFTGEKESGEAADDGLIEFAKGAQAYVRLSIMMKVVNGRKAFCNVDKVYIEIIKIFRTAFRAYAEDQNLRDLVYFPEEGDDDKSELTVNKDKIRRVDLNAVLHTDNYESDDVWNRIHQNWGVEVIELKLEDVILTAQERTKREEEYFASIDVKIARKAKEKTVIEAEAIADKTVIAANAKFEEKKKLADADLIEQEKASLGYAKIVESLGGDVEKATQIISETIKWEGISKTDNPVLILAGQDAASLGAQLASGANAVSKKNDQEKK